MPRIPDPDDPAYEPTRKGMLSVPLGIVGAAQGALVGYLRSRESDSLAGLDGTPTYLEGGAAVVLDGNATFCRMLGYELELCAFAFDEQGREHEGEQQGLWWWR